MQELKLRHLHLGHTYTEYLYCLCRICPFSATKLLVFANIGQFVLNFEKSQFHSSESKWVSKSFQKIEANLRKWHFYTSCFKISIDLEKYLVQLLLIFFHFEDKGYVNLLQNQHLEPYQKTNPMLFF